MMTFKDFLREDEDVEHHVEEAARVFVERCKQWKDVDVPLYRLSHPGGGAHKLRTRSPRKRQTESLGGTREIQKMIFEQNGWERFPDRQHSIFCSTQKKFEVGTVDDFSENLLMIYPFDGVNMGSTVNVVDFNYIDLMNGIDTQPQVMMYFHSFIRGWKQLITDDYLPADESFTDTLNSLKKILLKNGKFDPTCNGNRAYEKNLDELREKDWEIVRFIVTKIPEVWTPDFVEVELVTPSTIDLPGRVREVWFSGKYLSIPAIDHKQFVQAVKAIQNGEEPPAKKKVTRVKAVKAAT